MEHDAARLSSRHYAVGIAIFALLAATYLLFYSDVFATVYEKGEPIVEELKEAVGAASWPAPLDTEAYNERMLALAHVPIASTTEDAVRAASTTSPPLMLRTESETMSVSVEGKVWPARAAYPHGGALLPFNRIVAYYGNYFSTQMGILGEYDEDIVLEKLKTEAASWAAADPSMPVIPAIHYIAVVAQSSATRNGLWIARMPDEEVDHALAMAAKINGVVFLDVQVGKSTVEKEIPMLEKYLSMPHVHLGIDPEFSMKTGAAPGTVIGTFDAADINFTIDYLAKLVRDHKLPPKVLVVHRFTQGMVTNYERIKTVPEVQVVMQMDGWGEPARKKNTYRYIVAPEPVQFTGFKIFYKADLRPPSTRLMTKDEVLSLTPAPIYIQYQ